MSENKGNNESSLNPEARIKSIGTKQPRVDLVKCNAKTVFGFWTRGFSQCGIECRYWS